MVHLIIKPNMELYLVNTLFGTLLLLIILRITNNLAYNIYSTTHVKTDFVLLSYNYN